MCYVLMTWNIRCTILEFDNWVGRLVEVEFLFRLWPFSLWSSFLVWVDFLVGINLHGAWGQQQHRGQFMFYQLYPVNRNGYWEINWNSLYQLRIAILAPYPLSQRGLHTRKRWLLDTKIDWQVCWTKIFTHLKLIMSNNYFLLKIITGCEWNHFHSRSL